MHRFGTLSFFALFGIAAAVTLAQQERAFAQIAKEQGGFNLTLPATATGPELNAQSDLWVFEVSFKPMRMIWVDVTDAKTKEKQRKLIWYQVYKAVLRPLPARDVDVDVVPVNKFDPVPTPLFVPEFSLVTNDNNRQNIYPDVILPEAEAVIARRERLPLKNSVEIVGDIPAMTPFDAKKENAIYGVVMWEGVVSTTDYFTVYMSGFTSGYKLGKGAEGKPIILRRTIAQEFWRPGDRFDQSEREIRRRGEARWIYRPDPSASQSGASDGENPVPTP